jgi:hypothetical protein
MALPLIGVQLYHVLVLLGALSSERVEQLSPPFIDNVILIRPRSFRVSGGGLERCVSGVISDVAEPADSYRLLQAT